MFRITKEQNCYWPIAGRGRQLARGMTRSTIFFLICCFTSLLACSGHPDPEAALDHARQTLHHGDKTAGGEEVERGYKEFHNVSGEWAWKFTVLKASVLYGRGMD